MKINQKNKTLLLLIIAAIFYLSGISYRNAHTFLVGYEKKTNLFQKTLNGKEKELDTILNNLLINIKTKEEKFFMVNIRYYNDLYEKKGYSLFVYENKNLKYWSSNNVPVSNYSFDKLTNTQIQYLKNGWYRIIKKNSGRYTAIGLILLKNEYQYNNKYLLNNFQKDFKIGQNTVINEKQTGNYNIYSQDKKFLFSLIYKNDESTDNADKSIDVIFYVISLIFIVYFLLSLSKIIVTRYKKQIFYLVFAAVIIVLRFFSIYYKIPSSLYELELFSPKFYAVSFCFPSFGDLFLNILLLFFLVLVFSENYNLIKVFRRHKIWNKYITATLGIFILFVFSDFIVGIFKSIVINSNVSYNVNNIFKLDLFSITGFLLIGILFLSLFILIDKIVTYLVFFSKKVNFHIPNFVAGILLFMIYKEGFDKSDILNLSWTFIVIIIPLFSKIKTKNILSFYYIMLYLLLYSLFATFLINDFNKTKENEKRKSLAIKLSIEQDPIAEYIFTEIEQEIKKDAVLKNLISRKNFNEDSINKRIKKKYFSGYWTKYDVQITTCRPSDNLLMVPDNIEKNCFDLFNEKILSIGKPTISCDLYYLNKGTGKISYLSELSIPDKNNDLVNSTKFFVELDSKFVPQGIGYPELLLDKKVKSFIDPTEYSYSIYNNKQLITQYGKYLYNFYSDTYGKQNDEFNFFNKDDFNHLFYKVDDKTSLIISKKRDSFLNTITPFSYLFGFFGIISILFLFARKLPNLYKTVRANFKFRIQITTILIVLISLVIIGISSTYYILNLFENKNYENIKEKIHSISIELEHRISDVTSIPPNMNDYISELLIKYSNVYFIDINLYDPMGNLIASTRPKIFNEGLIGEKINPVALGELSINQKTLFINDENIGNMKYISAYIPFKNNNNKTIAYINLPYFSKQNEARKELSTFIVALINIYVLLFTLAIVVSLFVSNYITMPLQFIKMKMSRVKFGRKNENIEWKSEDEIGNLINEYNRMIKELERSAKMLAKSERESAWREMAKQVAHEIKNPLTPMKLSVQYLEKAWKDKAQNFDERLQKFTKTMIEQIDNLSAISSEFSDFAKMPHTYSEKIEISEIINNILDLYKNIENQEIIFSKQKEKEYFINGDRSQLQRILTNLINNAMQAIPFNKKGIISIELYEKDNMIIIKITDNGTGIAKGQLNKIFSPNFTTKTGGMGLGLAIVKSIVENLNGKIWFETKENEGTSFYVEFTKIK
ncbi:MAG: HAMP domain-containing sensor histidine kinase [Bacteroidales bacterium]|nr:HAMP domain-containing sensor histidine kinase [Bacteroidales bacterium]